MEALKEKARIHAGLPGGYTGAGAFHRQNYEKNIIKYNSYIAGHKDGYQEREREEGESGGYVVFENICGDLVQLSVSLPTLERAREYVKCWTNRLLYIYKSID